MHLLQQQLWRAVSAPGQSPQQGAAAGRQSLGQTPGRGVPRWGRDSRKKPGTWRAGAGAFPRASAAADLRARARARPWAQSCFLQCCSPKDPVAMVKEKGNYKCRSPSKVAEVGMVLQGSATSRGVIHGEPGRHVLGARISVLWSLGFHGRETSLSTLRSATTSEARPISELPDVCPL